MQASFRVYLTIGSGDLMRFLLLLWLLLLNQPSCLLLTCLMLVVSGAGTTSVSHTAIRLAYLQRWRSKRVIAVLPFCGRFLARSTSWSRRLDQRLYITGLIGYF